MADTGTIRTFYEDEDKTKPVFPRTSVGAVSGLQDAIDGKQDKLTVNPTETTSTLSALTIDSIAYSIGGGKIDDVQVDDASVVENKVAKIDSSNFGKVDDVKVDGTSIVTDKVASLVFNTAYNASSNKAATMQDITDAINNIPKYAGEVE